ncbi:MAG: Hsp70 family protein [Phaeospirillum sp.]|nr:Hsp70 family protein [Phaeospirillum sp.]
MGLAIGIDLGTTNSAVAIVDNHGLPGIVPNALGEAITPSVICFLGPDRYIVGNEAKELQKAGEPCVAAFFKRHMGDPNFLFHAHGRDYSATDLSAILLATLKADAEAVLGKTVTDAVITVPAYFKHPQREATIAAGRQAGLNVLQVVNEPSAAAIAYGVRKWRDGGRLLVYDLGGGTFDVTLAEAKSGEIHILASEGDHELGGKDWDDSIVQFAASRFHDEFGIDPLEDSISIADLLVRAEDAKKRLTSANSARISIVSGCHRGTYELSRQLFETLTSALMERTVSLTQHVLAEMKVAPSALDGILLVGGSTRMQMVHDFIRRAFGHEPLHGVNVDEAVALGAAAVAAHSGPASAGRFALAGGVRMVDVTNHSLGMIAINEKGSAYLNSIILPKNHPIPCTEERPYRFRTRRGGDNRLEIFVTQGEAGGPADVTYLGKYVLSGFPSSTIREVVVDIAYTYDVSGTVKVAGRLRSGEPLAVAVEALPDDIPDRFLGPPIIEAVPEHVTVYLTFDLSGSMSGTPLSEAKKAGRRFVDNLDLAHCSVGVIAVADRVQVVLHAAQDARKIAAAIDGLEIGQVGSCNDAEPFAEALKLLGGVEGPRYVVALADGVWSNQPRAISNAKACHQQEIDVVAIGFGSADQAFLRAIASSDEAGIFTSLGNLGETFASIAQVITEAGAGPPSSGQPRGRGLFGLFKGH